MRDPHGRERLEELESLVRRVAEQALPGEQVEAYAVHRSDVDVEVFDRSVESLSAAEVAGIGVRVVHDSRQGFAYAGFVDETTAAEVLADARDNASFGTPDDALGLPGPADVGVPVGLDLASAGFGSLDTAAKVDMALELEAATLAADPRVRTVESSAYGDADVHVAIANSLGVRASQHRTIASVSAVAIAEDAGGPQTGFGFDLARDPAALDLGPVAAEAAARATRMLGATQPESQRVPVLLDCFVAQSLLGVIGGTLNGEAALKGRSIFGDRVGDAIAAAPVTLIDDPTDAAAFGASCFDAEGVATRRNELVSAGSLNGFAHNCWTAARLGTATTGSAARASYKSTPGVGMSNFGLVPGTDATAELMRRAEGGIFVQTLHGLHSGVNPVSGDFSVGVDGLWIRDGALAEPIREATIASTLQRMLLDVVAVGAEVRRLTSGPAVPVLLDEMTLAGR